MPSQPIKVTWTREEDMTHDVYRPMAAARFKAVLNQDKISAAHLEVAAESVVTSQMGRIGMTPPGPDGTITQAAWDQPYNIPNYRVTGYRVPAMLPVGFWRSVGASQNGFFHESMIDELAHAAGADPLEFRLAMIDHEPSAKVLKSVANLSGWRSPVPKGHGRGLAFVMSFGVPTAQVIEVAKHKDGIRIVSAFAAVDVGIALDPENIKAQVTSGMYFGLTAAMLGEISVKGGIVEQTNFHSYDGLRINQAPPVQVSILENGERIRGIGEPGTPPAAPALANAIFAATGNRIRELPMRKHIKFV
jgi:isoquinoline 1-oxidoreductase beta subunit